MGAEQGCQEIAKSRTIRVRSPLLDAVSVRVKKRAEILETKPESFGAIKGFEVFETNFNFWGKSMIVGSVHHLGLSYSSPVLVLLRENEIRPLILKVIDSYRDTIQSITEEVKTKGDPDDWRNEAILKDNKRLNALKRRLGIPGQSKEFPVPGAMILFESVTISRIHAIINFKFGIGGFSYQVTNLGSDPIGLVRGLDGAFLEFGDMGFIKIEKSDLSKANLKGIKCYAGKEEIIIGPFP
jgi:hypothetical protein